MAVTAGAQQGKTWLITGASCGFGRFMAEHLYGRGATAVATARNVDDLPEFTTLHLSHRSTWFWAKLL